MAVTQYIGARYVPLFADPLAWDNERTYEPLTIVLYQGASYTSRQAVPVGIDISNEDYWALTGNYNAQVEQYRTEMREAVSNVEEIGQQATASATAAKTSETNAGNSATAAAKSATAAAKSATESANSATAAANSATEAKNSESVCTSSANSCNTYRTQASTAANNAATSATEAANSASAAKTSETNAATNAAKTNFITGQYVRAQQAVGAGSTVDVTVPNVQLTSDMAKAGNLIAFATPVATEQEPYNSHLTVSTKVDTIDTTAETCSIHLYIHSTGAAGEAPMIINYLIMSLGLQ